MAGELTTLSLSMGLGIVSDGVVPPPGFAWLADFEGNAVFDSENNRLYGAI